MLTSNLSTRPFYNERLVSLLLTLLAFIGLALAAFNVTQLRSLSTERANVMAAVTRDEDAAARIEGGTEALRQQANQGRLELLAGATHEANTLIEQRTFSWTSFFGYVEQTLPLDAYLEGVAPRLEKGQFYVRMGLISRTAEDVEAFAIALERTGAFRTVVPETIVPTESGTLRTIIEAVYLAPPSEGRPAPAPAGRGQS